MNSNSVVLTPCPRGRRFDGVANVATPLIYPGTCILPVPAGIPDAGARLPWEPWNIGDNAPSLIAIADVDWLQGKIAPNAQDVGRRFPIYIPVPGDELNLRLADSVGSTFTPAISVGDFLCPQINTGFLVPRPSIGTTGYNTRPFMALENQIAEPAANQPSFIRVIFTGY